MPCKPDEHTWEPGGGMGRYRCSKCFALGYRGIINQAQKTGSDRSYEPGSRGSKRMSSIIPYKCKRKDCKAPAVKRKPQRCAAHSRRKK